MSFDAMQLRVIAHQLVAEHLELTEDIEWEDVPALTEHEWDQVRSVIGHIALDHRRRALDACLTHDVPALMKQARS